jgi:hypothetical protein
MNNHKNGSHKASAAAALPAGKALDAYFLEARCKILDVAAILDRIDRGPGAGSVAGDARLARIRAALEMLMDDASGRAERIQQIFSLDYDPKWVRPTPR